MTFPYLTCTVLIHGLESPMCQTKLHNSRGSISFVRSLLSKQSKLRPHQKHAQKPPLGYARTKTAINSASQVNSNCSVAASSRESNYLYTCSVSDKISLFHSNVWLSSSSDDFECEQVQSCQSTIVISYHFTEQWTKEQKYECAGEVR